MTVERLSRDLIASEAAALSVVHCAAFAESGQRGWTTDEIVALSERDPFVLFACAGGFLAADVVVDEAEILTVAVGPDEQGKGLGHRLLDAALEYFVSRNLIRCHLEVASGNHSAISLYQHGGFERVGHRRGYFTRKNSKDDAILMQRLLNGK